MTPHIKAVLQAMLVTFIWSLSWVFIKFGLKDDIPPFIFAALRYHIAFWALLIWAYPQRGSLLTHARDLSRRDWGWLVGLGLIYYTATQGLQYIALDYLPAITLSLLLSFTVIAIALMGIGLLKEYPNAKQWGGMGIFVVGVLIYFYPINLPTREAIGVIIGLVVMLANAVSGILGRYINRANRTPALLVTLISMGIGSVLMLGIGVVWEGLPPLSWQNWLLIAWLAVVHTAFTFTLWNQTLRTLSSVESSLINNTMLVQIAILAWVFLGERISGQGMVGLALVLVGVLVVQLTATKRSASLVAQSAPASVPEGATD